METPTLQKDVTVELFQLLFKYRSITKQYSNNLHCVVLMAKISAIELKICAWLDTTKGN